MNMVGSVAGHADAPQYHRFRSGEGEHILIVPRSRIYDIGRIDPAADSDGIPYQAMDPQELGSLVEALIETIALAEPDRESLSGVAAPAPQSISLNVSSSCNLSCSYCYAARGAFEGAQPEPMNFDTARLAIDSLLARADPAAPITIGFLGGEPFVNRRLIHQAVAHGEAGAIARGLDLRFSVTTNGTLLREEDLRLLRERPFAVTVSIDGDVRTHERLRPFFNGQGGSHSQMCAAISPLLRDPGQAQIAARATVTRFDLDIARAYDAILKLGFSEVGFSPLKAGPDGAGPLRDDDWSLYLDSLITLARRELRTVLQGGRIRLTNFAVALKQLHRGACSPYPCGAGGGYFSVAANGDWYTCHRAIGDKSFHVGDSSGLDPGRRVQFLEQRHVHAQTDCRRCWARYLCSGSCHQEAARRTEQSCDFVRGWLDFCLAAYCEVSSGRPDYFSTPHAASHPFAQRRTS